MSAGLVDKFGRVHKYLRISLTENCNLACNYCMPKEPTPNVFPSKLLTSDEIETLARVFKNLGVEKVRLTGGEPTLRSDFKEILSRINAVGFKKVGITTNGLLIHKFWNDLIENNVNMLNISLDTLDDKKFELISNRPKKFWGKIMSNIKFAIALKEAGKLDSVKINTVVMRHVNDDEIAKIANWAIKYPIQIRFIELMPFSGNAYSSKLFFGKNDILSALESHFGADLETLTQSARSTTVSSTGSCLYRVRYLPGEVGIISSMTDAFCSTCDRIRLTADGNIINCLFSKSELSLKEALRSEHPSRGEMIERVIRESIFSKFFSHGGVPDIRNEVPAGRPMVSIGG